jgi:hypothetical protein
MSLVDRGFGGEEAEVAEGMYETMPVRRKQTPMATMKANSRMPTAILRNYVFFVT